MTLETSLLQTFVGDHPSDAARALRGMEPSDVAVVLQALPWDSAGAILPLLSPLTAARALESVDPAEAGAMLSEAPPASAAPIVRTMKAERRASVLELLRTEEREALSALLRYSPGTAGALMDPEVLTVRENTTVGDVLEAMRTIVQHPLYYVYVVNDAQALVGVVSGRELADIRPDAPVALVANRLVESLPTRASSESIVAHPGWKRFHAIPVVEADGRFVGVIRYECLRELEERLLDGSDEDRSAETAAALAELYGLGLKGLFEWAATLLLGTAESRRRAP